LHWNLFIKELFVLAEPYLTVRDDLLHTQIAHEYALFLMEKEGGNKKIVEPAIILHDVGWSRLSPDEIEIAYGVKSKGEEGIRLNRIHEVEGAVIARDLLCSLRYDPQLTDQITRIIEQHDSGKKIRCLEEGLTKDADRLWRFSKIGYWKENERQKVSPEKRHKFLTERYKGWFFTKTAKEVAEKEIHQRARELKDRALV